MSDVISILYWAGAGLVAYVVGLVALTVAASFVGSAVRRGWEKAGRKYAPPRPASRPPIKPYLPTSNATYLQLKGATADLPTQPLPRVGPTGCTVPGCAPAGIGSTSIIWPGGGEVIR